MKNWIYLICIVIAVAALGPSLIDKAFAWTLFIDLYNKPFGDDKAWVQVKGQDGWVDSAWYSWASIRTSNNAAMVTWDLPDSEFPPGSAYEVCVSSKEIALLFPTCITYTHGNSDESVSVPLG